MTAKSSLRRRQGNYPLPAMYAVFPSYDDVERSPSGWSTVGALERTACTIWRHTISPTVWRIADSNRRRLRSSSSSQLVIRRTRLSTVGDRNRAFPVAGSRLWNSLPRDVTPDPIRSLFSGTLLKLTHSRFISFPNASSCQQCYTTYKVK